MYILERLNVQKKTESEYIKQKLISMGFQVIGEECTKNEEQQNIAELLQVENEKLKTELQKLQVENEKLKTELQKLQVENEKLKTELQGGGECADTNGNTEDVKETTRGKK